ncbi:MAG: MFS transporter [Bryobacterales bacterium]|nr:MFS transporter [Bryobacterales bacterium]
MSTAALDAPLAAELVRRRAALSIALLCAGHFAVDLYAGALGALQPLLVERFGISLTQAGFLGGLLVFSSSVMQPAYGYLSDRVHTRLFTVLGPAVAGVFISSLGLAPSFVWLLLLVFIGGSGSAAYHPPASARVLLGIEEGRGRAMAFFVSAGTLGTALGPAYFSTVSGWLGFSGTWWAALPGVLVAALLFRVLPPPATPAHGKGRFDWKPLAAVWRPLSLLYMLVFLRSIIQIVFAQFLPLYLHLVRGRPILESNYIMSAYLAAGAIGGFVGGHAADRFGGRAVMRFSMIASAPVLLLFFFTNGFWSVVGLILGGFILLFTIPVNVVMAQELAPSQAGTVSALMMGFAWGMAGVIFIPLVGFAADLFSLHAVLASLTVFPVIGFLLTLKLPK